MIGKDSPQYVIDSYRKRQRMTPFLVGGLAVVLVVVGIIILVIWFMSGDKSALSFLASATPTLTNTATYTPVPPTATPTITSTVTLTPTVTLTVTPNGPFEYTVQESESCWSIALKYNVELAVILALNPSYGQNCIVKPGDKLLVPAPGQKLPTETPGPTLPFAPGQVTEYTVKLGDTLAVIAQKYNTTVDEIIKENNIKDMNKIAVGDKLTFKRDIVTATPTRASTSTSAPGTSAATSASTTGTGTPKATTPTVSMSTATKQP